MRFCWETSHKVGSANIMEWDNKEHSAKNMSYGISTTQFSEPAKMNMEKKNDHWD
jgi:hypothetical protein